MQAIQERHENSLLKSEMDKLREENKAMREQINKACCPNCGTATTSQDPAVTAEEPQLKIENARLKAEVRKIIQRKKNLLFDFRSGNVFDTE